MKTIVSTILALISFILGFVLFAYAFEIGYDKAMIVHCHTLDAQSKELKDFFISKIDKEECSKVYGITIDASVR